METRWLYRRSEDFNALRDISERTCIIPMGCIEKHGLHLPLGTDILHASHIAYLASQIEPVCIFPDYTFGDATTGAVTVPAGTVTLSLQLQLQLLEELCDQIGENGFHKIAIYNGHGGNTAWLNQFLRYMGNKKKPYVVVVITLLLSAPHTLAEHILANGEDSVPEMTKEDIELVLKYHAQNMRIGHACFGETAYIMDICPETVRLDRLGIESGLPTGEPNELKAAGIYMKDGGWIRNYPNNFDGHDPIGCNERIGRAAVRLEAERVARAYKVLKEDKKLLQWLHRDQDGWGETERK